MSERGGGNPVGAARSPAGVRRNMPISREVPLGARSTFATGTAAPSLSPDTAARLLRSRMTDSFSFGIEEEYFLVDHKTKSVVLERPPQFLTDVKQALGDQVTTEMLQSQIEVSTLPHIDMGTACAELRHLRYEVARVAAEHGFAIFA